jgi:hypothetical protein
MGKSGNFEDSSYRESSFESNPGPLAPEARIIPLDQFPYNKISRIIYVIHSKQCANGVKSHGSSWWV